MTNAVIAAVTLFGVALVGGDVAGAAPLSSDSVNAPLLAAIPHPVKIARTTTIPACTSFVDTALKGVGTGTVTKPFKTIAAAVKAAKSGGVICVAQGVYAEKLFPGTKPLTLAGGFQTGKAFKVRDSAKYISQAKGSGGSFIRIEDPGPTGAQLTAIDGFEITGYSQAIYRDIYYSQKFNITNNFIHDNVCSIPGLAGGGFALNNVSGVIRGNVITRNRCARGGAGALNDSTNQNTVSITSNLIQSNAGNEPQISHGGGLYLFGNKLTITGNEFVGNSVTGWGAGLYVGAFTGGGQHTTATQTWNIYRTNRAGIAGGGFFCDDSAHCLSDHEVFNGNCGGNIYVDSGPGGSGATVASFDHLTNVGARSVGCGAAGIGVQVDKDNTAPDTYTFKNAIFSGNAAAQDFVGSCSSGCSAAKVTVTYSMAQKNYVNNGVKVTFGAGILAPANPQFVDAAAGNFHLKSTFGHWTPTGYVTDAVKSPALAKGDPAGPVDQQPPRAGTRTELGTYGNSSQASYVR